jgi:hypothetical protein
MLVQHYNTRPHTGDATSAAIDSIGFAAIPHPPHCLNLAPTDFSFFAALKKHLKGINFTCDKQVQAAVRKWFLKQPKQFCNYSFEKLGQCC